MLNQSVLSGFTVHMELPLPQHYFNKKEGDLYKDYTTAQNQPDCTTSKSNEALFLPLIPLLIANSYHRKS